jgi:trimethylamine-N-oxide reductase (cytochrome c)
MESDCLYCDIILPISTIFEMQDINQGADLKTIFLEDKCIEPIGESKSDYEALGEVAKKLGLYDKYTGGKTNEEWLKTGWEKSGVADQISWEQLKEKKYWVSPVKPDWEKDPVGLTGFYNDPAKNPLTTPSGKVDFYSQRIADAFPTDKERGPVAHWTVGGPASAGWSHDESLWGERAKKYPLLLVSNHPRWRLHAQNDDNSWMREIPTCKVKGYDGYLYEPVWIHPTDAAKRGIKSGDIVKMYTDVGTVLGGAYVTERIIPGSVYQDHGARVDLITDKIDRGGSTNLINPPGNLAIHCGGGIWSGFLVELAKVSGDEMQAWREKYPEAFARDYDPASGLRFDAWVEGGA